MTSPPQKHTRPLTRRQRIALGLEVYVPIARPVRPERVKRPLMPKYPIPKPKEEPVNLSRRERIDLSIKEDERRAKTAAWLKTVPLEQWQQWIQEDEKRLVEDEARRAVAQADKDWYASSLNDYRKMLGIRGDYKYSKDGKTVYLNITSRSEDGNKVYITIDADDLERVASREWTQRQTAGGTRIACLQYIPQISLGRWIATSPARKPVRHLNGDRLDYRKRNLHPMFPVPPPNKWGNHRPARLLSERVIPPSPPKQEKATDYSQFYGPKWWAIQPIAMARAGGKCERCKKKKPVHVHHILPVRYFSDPADAHFLENTLAVCLPCHQEEHRQLKHRFPLFNRLVYQFQN